MFKVLFPSSLIWFCFIFLTLITHNKGLNIEGQSHYQRNLESPFHSVMLLGVEDWGGLEASLDPPDSDDLYLTQKWSIFISSNETIVSDGNCPLFIKFTCSKPDCYEDDSLQYSLTDPFFLSTEATRVKVSPQTISIANRAWRINSSPLYIHNCELNSKSMFYGASWGQIGLGLSGNASQNFQTPNPIFSIIFHDRYSIELIFGFNSTYVNNPSTAISLCCDLDWKIQVNSIAIENSSLGNHNMTLIFDLATQFVTLPMPYYSSLKDYFFKISTCFDEPKTNNFNCFHYGNIHDLPSLVFNLENGSKFILAPEAYIDMTVESSFYLLKFVLFNSTVLGIDYIILGRTLMSYYYTVFEQLSNNTPIITLYPTTNTSLKYDELQINSKPLETQGESNSPPLNNTKDTTPEAKETHTPESQYPDSEIAEIDNMQEVQQVTDYTWCFILFIFITIVYGIIYFYIKGRKTIQHDKMVKEQRPTLELNGSSYFVSSENSIQEDHEGHASE